MTTTDVGKEGLESLIVAPVDLAHDSPFRRKLLPDTAYFRFNDNNSFLRWLTDTVFALTYA